MNDLVNKLRGAEMTTDIDALIERLGVYANLEANDLENCLNEAAQVITTLRDRVKELEDALFPFARLAQPLVDDGAQVAIGLTDDHFIAARAALENKGEGNE